jgi:hypothetical protein
VYIQNKIRYQIFTFLHNSELEGGVWVRFLSPGSGSVPESGSGSLICSQLIKEGISGLAMAGLCRIK